MESRLELCGKSRKAIFPQGLKPDCLPSTYVGAKAPTPDAEHIFPQAVPSRREEGRVQVATPEAAVVHGLRENGVPGGRTGGHPTWVVLCYASLAPKVIGRRCLWTIAN